MPNQNPIVKKVFVKRKNSQDENRIYSVFDFWSEDECKYFFDEITKNGTFRPAGTSGSERENELIRDSEYGFKNLCMFDEQPVSVTQVIHKVGRNIIDWSSKKLDIHLDIHYTLTNWFFYGDYSTAHTDSKSARFTAITFLNPVWNHNHGSGTMIFEDDPRYLAHYAYPSPGSFVLFPSNMFHKAVPPEKMNTQGRLSIAFQLKMRE